MTEYTKIRESGLVLAKRGYCYFLYPTMAHLAIDDKAEKEACDRLNAGIPVANRCYSPNMLGYTRKLNLIPKLEQIILENHPDFAFCSVLQV